MILYRLDYSDPDHGIVIQWFKSKRERTAAISQLRREIPSLDSASFAMSEVTFPITKTAVVRWLNANLNRDNG